MPDKAPRHNPAPDNIKKHTVRRPERAKIYSSSRWFRLRMMALTMHPLCADPYGLHKKHNETVAATDVDHILPIADYPEHQWDLNNLQGLCKSCHSKKTRAENKHKDKS